LGVVESKDSMRLFILLIVAGGCKVRCKRPVQNRPAILPPSHPRRHTPLSGRVQTRLSPCT